MIFTRAPFAAAVFAALLGVLSCGSAQIETASTAGQPPLTGCGETTAATSTITGSTTMAEPSEPTLDPPNSQVEELQTQLAGLGYWLGDIDGVEGDATAHAIVALQKAAGIERTGHLDDATQAALDAEIRPAARSTQGRVIEIDLAKQLFLVVTDGVVDIILDTSTGATPGSTPTGTWSVERQIDGLRQADLGLLYRPKYFHQGVAIHGYTSVPPTPESHGCVRLTYAAMDMLWASDLAPIGTTVEVY